MLIRDGELAVLYFYSDDWQHSGYKWSSYSFISIKDKLEMVTNKRLVLAVLGESQEDPIKVAKELFPRYDNFIAGFLNVEWVPEGTKFKVKSKEYGNEYVVIKKKNKKQWFNG